MAYKRVVLPSTPLSGASTCLLLSCLLYYVSCKASPLVVPHITQPTGAPPPPPLAAAVAASSLPPGSVLGTRDRVAGDRVAGDREAGWPRAESSRLATTSCSCSCGIRSLNVGLHQSGVGGQVGGRVDGWVDAWDLGGRQ